MKVRKKKGVDDSVAMGASIAVGLEIFGALAPNVTPTADHDAAIEQLLAERLEEVRARMNAIRREDINEFIEYVGKDDRTGQHVKQAPIHEEFQHILETQKRIIFMSFPESGKSNQAGIFYPLFRLGKNPNLRIAIVSKTGDSATKSARSIRSYIEKSDELAQVFPELIPGDKWEEDYFTVRRGVHSRDPSVQALRVDLLILDDILDQENTSSPAERKKVLRRLRAGFFDRLAEGAQVVFLTNAWHPEDAAHQLERDGGWHVKRIPVEDAEGNPTWEEKWSRERIAEARVDLGPLEFARAHLCKARDEGESPFDQDAIEAAQKKAVDLDLELVYEFDQRYLPEGAMILTGVDLAVSGETKKATSHLTALVTVLYWPQDGSKQLLWVEAGRWSSREIRNRVLDHDKRYGSIFIVENNAAQRWIIDIINNQDDLQDEEKRYPAIVPFTTGRNKAHPQFGVEGLAVEIAAGHWIFPKTGAPAAVIKNVEELITEMVYYTRGGHTGDRLMALWFAREGTRKGAKAGKTTGGSGVRVLEPSVSGPGSGLVVR